MLIRQVDLENIKSYERASVTFTPGVNAIVGHNGAGKSTILEAIGFALFDSLPYKTSDFIREGTRSGTIAVVFESSHDERPYRVERKIGGSQRYLVLDEELHAKLCEGKADVLAFVRRHSGAEADVDLARLFADAVGVPQGTLTAAFLQAPSQRKPVFDALLQVDEYRTAVDRLLEPRNLLVERQRDAAQQVAVLQARLERLPLLETIVAEREAELATIARTLGELETRLGQVRQRRAALESVRREVEALERQQAALAERSTALAAQLAAAERLLAAAEAAQVAVQANLAGHDCYAAAQSQRAQLDVQVRERAALQAARAAADKRLALTAADIERAEQELAAVAAAEQQFVALAPAVAQQAHLEQQLLAAQQAQHKLAELERTCADLDAQVRQLEVRKGQLAGQLARAVGVQQAIAAAEARKATLAADVARHAQAFGECEGQGKEIGQQIKTLKEVTTPDCPVCAQPLTPTHKAGVIQQWEQRLAELRANYPALRHAKAQAESELKQETERHQQLLDEARKLPRQAELDDVTLRQAEASKALAAQQAERATLAAALPEVAALNRELAALGDPRRQSLLAAQQAGQRAAVEQRRAGLVDGLAAARRQVDEAEASLQALAGLDAALAQVEADLAAHAAAYQAVIANRQQAESTSTRRAECERSRAALSETENARTDLELGLKNLLLQLDLDEYSRLLSEEQTVAGQVGELQGRSRGLNHELQSAAAEVATLRLQQVELADLEAAHGRLLAQSAVLETVRTLLRQSGPYITQALIRQISAGAAQIFGELMQDFSRQLRWNDDYGITLEVDGVARQFNQLSGGEQMSAALAVRLALVREISNIDIAFFDEPTANLDDVRREALAQQVMNVKGFRQLFVISHDDTFEQATQNLVRIKRHGSTSIVDTVQSG